MLLQNIFRLHSSWRHVEISGIGEHHFLSIRLSFGFYSVFEMASCEIIVLEHIRSINNLLIQSEILYLGS